MIAKTHTSYAWPKWLSVHQSLQSLLAFQVIAMEPAVGTAILANQTLHFKAGRDKQVDAGEMRGPRSMLASKVRAVRVCVQSIE